MDIKSPLIARSRPLAATMAVALMLLVGGCGEAFEQKSTELQSDMIRREVSRIKPAKNLNVDMPPVYTAPPRMVKQIVGGAEEWKLFYFCKHHLSDARKNMVNEQFAHKLFNEKGKSTTTADYTVSSSPATNQLIVRCPTRNDVDAVLQFLDMVDVAPIQVRIDCLISEIYADKTLDRETTLEIGDLLGESITAGGSAKLFGADVLELIQEQSGNIPFLPAFPGASLREVARAKMGLKVGYFNKKHDFLALVDLLESKGYLKILMNPSLEVVNGQKARIESSEMVPLEKISLRDRDGFVETRTDYVDVVDALEITPHVFADGYIGLETTALIGSKNIPEGVKQIRIVSKRQIYNKENRIRHGQSLVIGGIRKSEEHAVVRGVPFLKDIPAIGALFSSKDYEQRATETIFILTPTISTGGRPNKVVLDEIRRKHAPVLQPDKPEQYQQPVQPEQYKQYRQPDRQGTNTDPLGLDSLQQSLDMKLQQLQPNRFETVNRTQNTNTWSRAKNQTLHAEAARASAQAELAKAQTAKLKAEIEKARAEAEKAKAEAEMMKARAIKEKAAEERNKAVAAKDK